MRIEDMNLPVLAQQRGCSVEHLLDEIALEEDEARDNFDDERIALLKEMRKSPEEAAAVFSDWCSTHTLEEIGAITLHLMATVYHRGQSALMPTEFFALWAEVVSPVIDRAAQHKAKA
ncbi:MAG: hypothetical protein JWL63_2708 [Rhodocyclales bacterium]|nr:hypothetical protein [Rhodocyclales bacterium]